MLQLQGHAGNPDKCQEALNAGMQTVLNKPPAEEELDNLLQKYVTKVDVAEQIASHIAKFRPKSYRLGRNARCLPQ